MSFAEKQNWVKLLPSLTRRSISRCNCAVNQSRKKGVPKEELKSRLSDRALIGKYLGAPKNKDRNPLRGMGGKGGEVFDEELAGMIHEPWIRTRTQTQAHEEQTPPNDERCGAREVKYRRN